MVEQLRDGRRQRPKQETVTGSEPWWKRTIFRPRAEVAGAKDDGRERDVFGRERGTSGEPGLDHGPARHVHAVQAGGQGSRVVGHDQVARAKKVEEPRSRRVCETSARVDGKQP